MDVPQHSNSKARETPTPPAREALRLFLYEPGWGVDLKSGSDRVFCYMMAPGQNYYHRLLDGELYLRNHEERLCFACAERRGLIVFTPKALREPLSAIDLDADPSTRGFPLEGEEENETSEDEDDDATD